MNRDTMIPFIALLVTLGSLCTVTFLIYDLPLGVGLLGCVLSGTAVVLLYRRRR